MLRYLIVLLLLSGCAGKDLNFNPWTTILNQVIKAELKNDGSTSKQEIE